jgi:GWxTD domain-containing protein
VYAHALLSLEELRQPGLAMAARSGSLAGRIERILMRERPQSILPVLVLLGGLPFLLAPFFLATLSEPPALAQPPAPRPPASAKAAQAPAPAASKPRVPDAYRRWMEQDAAYLISAEERARFESLTTDEQRKAFIEQFWKRRDPVPATAVNEAMEEHYRRIQYANQRFSGAGRSGWTTERGRAYILYGPPDTVESHPYTGTPEYLDAEIGRVKEEVARAARVYRESHPELRALVAKLDALVLQRAGGGESHGYERWFYRNIPGVGSNVSFEFGTRPNPR